MTDLQLRRYEIKPGDMEQFLTAWRGIIPVRESYGFHVKFAYVDAEANEFIWAVECDRDFVPAEREYYKSPERASLALNPADHVAVAHVSMVVDAGATSG